MDSGHRFKCAHWRPSPESLPTETWAVLRAGTKGHRLPGSRSLRGFGLQLPGGHVSSLPADVTQDGSWGGAWAKPWPAPGSQGTGVCFPERLRQPAPHSSLGDPCGRTLRCTGGGREQGLIRWCSLRGRVLASAGASRWPGPDAVTYWCLPVASCPHLSRICRRQPRWPRRWSGLCGSGCDAARGRGSPARHSPGRPR